MFTADDLANMRKAQTEHMFDLCAVLAYSAGTLNEYNEADAPTYTQTALVSCGLDMRPSSERHGADMTTIQYDATLRLPIGTPVEETSRIKILGRFEEMISPLIYEIVSPIQRGPSGIRLVLRKIVT